MAFILTKTILRTVTASYFIMTTDVKSNIPLNLPGALHPTGRVARSSLSLVVRLNREWVGVYFVTMWRQTVYLTLINNGSLAPKNYS